MPRVALYARVSTTDQHPEIQIHALRAYAEARGFEVVETYIDHGVSGAKDRRPALDRLLADARRRRFDVLAITKLDRLARSVRHLTTMAAEPETLGIDLVVLDQSLDTGTPAGRLLFNVLGSIAEFERDLNPRAHAGRDCGGPAPRRAVRPPRCTHHGVGRACRAPASRRALCPRDRAAFGCWEGRDPPRAREAQEERCRETPRTDRGARGLEARDPPTAATNFRGVSIPLSFETDGNTHAPSGNRHRPRPRALAARLF
jgi:DNA invertase Pin-like site-specific DNA recombinase